MGSAIVAPWKQLLLNALQSNSHLKHSFYFQLATIGSNGRPANGTVVFRSKTLNVVRLLRYVGVIDSWEQFQINGPVDVIDGSIPDHLKLQQREKAWFASSPRSRLQYLGPHPGLPYLSEQSDIESSLYHSTVPVDAFCLLVLDPEQVDYLNLKSNERVIFTAEQSVNGEKLWNSERINL